MSNQLKWDASVGLQMTQKDLSLLKVMAQKSILVEQFICGITMVIVGRNANTKVMEYLVEGFSYFARRNEWGC